MMTYSKDIFNRFSHTYRKQYSCVVVTFILQRTDAIDLRMSTEA